MQIVVLAAYLVPLAVALTLLLARDQWVVALALALVEAFVFTTTKVAARPSTAAPADRVRPVRGAPTTGPAERPRADRQALLLLAVMTVVVGLLVGVIVYGATQS